MANTFLTGFLKVSTWQTVVILLVLVALFVLINTLYRKKGMSFAKVVLLGTGLGLVLGLAVQALAGFPDSPASVTFIAEATTWFSMIGGMFTNAISMIVVPLVMACIMQVIVNMEGTNMGQMVSKTILVTLGMAAVSVIIGLAFGIVSGLGAGIAADAEEGAATIKDVTPLATTIKNLVPNNIITAMYDRKVIGLVIFSAIFGIAVRWLQDPEYGNPKLAEALGTGINSLHAAMINMADWILDYMPWAVICLLANTICSRGLAAIVEVMKFIVALYLACIVQLVLQCVLLLVQGLNPMAFLKKAYPTLLMAFTSRSSVGTLPQTIKSCRRLGVSEAVASFVPTFCTTAGMQGCAGVFPALLVVWVCRLTNTPLDISMLVMAVIVITIGSLGIAGIPGTATMAASVALSGVGMAQHFNQVAPLIAVDPLVDMGRTCLNVAGGITNAVTVDNMLGTLDKAKYNDMNA